MTEKKGKAGSLDVKALLAEDADFLRTLVQTMVQEILEAEMSAALDRADFGQGLGLLLCHLT